MFLDYNVVRLPEKWNFFKKFLALMPSENQVGQKQDEIFKYTATCIH